MATPSPGSPSPPITVQLLEAPYQPLERLAAWQRSLAAEEPDATVSAAESHFIGRVRPTAAGGEALTALELEHYPGMTEGQLQRLTAACARRHPVAAGNAMSRQISGDRLGRTTRTPRPATRMRGCIARATRVRSCAIRDMC